MSACRPLVALLFLASAAAAQSGPWKDGELLVYAGPTVYRVDPESGHGEPFLSGFYAPGFAGSNVFDSFRGGLLMNISQPPDPYWFNRLWFVAQDGTATAVPGFDNVNVRAMAPTGDGRIYFLRHTSPWQGPQDVEYLDANDAVHTLLDATGSAPFQADVEHMVYDAPTNALIGSSSGWWSTTDCSPGTCSLYRIPLSADGTRVAGPMLCNSVVSSNEELMGLDHMPGGKLLLTVASGAFYPDEKLLTVDPLTLATAPWAKPQWGDINGGVWSGPLGRAVILDDAGNTLRSYGAGQDGLGTLIVTDVPVGDLFTGFAPAESFFEVDTNGPGCQGFAKPYGSGLAGKAGVVPTLGVVGCPDIGHVFTLALNDVVGGAAGVLFVGLAPASAPFKGGTFLVGTVVVQLPVAVGGAPGVAGAGSLGVPAVLADPALAGLSIHLQAAFADAAAVKGVSLTNGLRVQAE